MQGRFRSFFAIAVMVIGSVLGAARAQDITTDPFVLKTIARENFEPGGEYDLFSGARGSLDTSSRTGQISIVRTSLVRLGSYSLQGATINGSYFYILRFDNHPWWEHSPFTDVSTRADSVREQRADGGQTSVSINWTANQVHPDDAYDGAQGGGYPVPTGARDEYTYKIGGTATGVYLISSTDLQKLDTAGFSDRFQAYSDATLNNLGNAKNRLINGTNQFINSTTFSKALEGELDIFLSIRDGLFSGTNGLIQGFAGPELDAILKNSGNVLVNYYKSQDEKWQYASLSNFTSASNWVAENPLLLKSVDFALTATLITKFGTSATLSDLEGIASAEGRNLLTAEEIGSALKNDPYHNLPFLIRKEAAEAGVSTTFLGGDGQKYTLTQILGEMNGVKGRYEFIVNSDNQLSHQLFVPNGTLNGVPIKP